jgi:hypothetical protein
MTDGRQIEGPRRRQRVDFAVQPKEGSLTLQEVKHCVRNSLGCGARQPDTGSFAASGFVRDFVGFRMFKASFPDGKRED